MGSSVFSRAALRVSLSLGRDGFGNPQAHGTHDADWIG